MVTKQLCNNVLLIETEMG